MPFPYYFLWFLLNFISVFGGTIGQEETPESGAKVFQEKISNIEEEIVNTFKNELPFDNATVIENLVNAEALKRMLPPSISLTSISLISSPGIANLSFYALQCGNDTIEIEYELRNYQYAANFSNMNNIDYWVNVTFHSLRINLKYTYDPQFMKVRIVAGNMDVNVTSCQTDPLPEEPLVKGIVNGFLGELGRITYEKFDNLKDSDAMKQSLTECLKPRKPTKFEERYNNALIGTYPRKSRESNETIHFSVDDVNVTGLLILEMLKIECQSPVGPYNVTTTLNNVTGSVKWSYGVDEDNQTINRDNQFTIDNLSLNIGYETQEFKNLSRMNIALSLDFVKNANGCPDKYSFFEPVLLDEIKRIFSTHFLRVEGTPENRQLFR